jgi:hypothetical protein
MKFIDFEGMSARPIEENTNKATLYKGEVRHLKIFVQEHLLVVALDISASKYPKVTNNLSGALLLWVQGALVSKLFNAEEESNYS